MSMVTEAPLKNAIPTDQELIDFVVREARLIDQQRFDEWLDMYADDAFYWMPLEWNQTDPRLTCSLMYNRLINAPTSIVGHDDLEMYERAQEGLHSNGNEWVNLQRLYSPDEAEQTNVAVNGTSEWPMRHQFRAWSKFMTMGM